MKRPNHVYLKYSIMGKIIKENGKIWLEEKSESYGVVHTKRIHIGDYDEIEDEKPKKKRKKSN